MTKKSFREKVILAKEYFRKRGFDVEKHLVEFETPQIRQILAESRATGEDFTKLLERHYGTCLKNCLEELADRAAIVLAENVPVPDLTSEEGKRRLSHMTLLPFYFLYRFGNNHPEY